MRSKADMPRSVSTRSPENVSRSTRCATSGPAYEYRVRKELELSPATFSDKHARAEMVHALKEVGEGIRQLAQKVRSGAVT